MVYGAAMQAEREAKAAAEKRYPNPIPKSQEIRAIKRVADYGNYNYSQAHELSQRAPFTFKCLLDEAMAEAEAEGVALRYAETKRKQQENSAKFAKQSLTQRPVGPV